MKKIIFAAFLAALAACSSSSHDSSPATNGAAATKSQPGSQTVSGHFYSTDPVADSTALDELRQKIEIQRQAIIQEKNALDAALSRRDNRVHFGKDFINTVSYGISSGALGYDFFKDTGTIARVKAFFGAKNLPALEPIAGEAATDATSVLKVGGAAAARSPWLVNAGNIVFRSTELVSAAVLGAFFVGDVYNMGSDVVVWFDSTEEIRAQRARLLMAEHSLQIAEQNLEAAQQSTSEPSTHMPLPPPRPIQR